MDGVKELKGKTQSGFAYKIRASSLNDARLLDLFMEMNNDSSVLPRLLIKILGKEQKEALYNHLTTEDGRVPFDALERDLASIFNNHQPTKNS